MLVSDVSGERLTHYINNPNNIQYAMLNKQYSIKYTPVFINEQ